MQSTGGLPFYFRGGRGFRGQSRGAYLSLFQVAVDAVVPEGVLCASRNRDVSPPTKGERASESSGPSEDSTP